MTMVFFVVYAKQRTIKILNCHVQIFTYNIYCVLIFRYFVLGQVSWNSLQVSSGPEP